MRIACIVWAQELITERTCLLTDILPVIVTPRIFKEDTRVMPGWDTIGPHDRFGLSLVMADNISVSENETVSKKLCVQCWRGGDTVVNNADRSKVLVEHAYPLATSDTTVLPLLSIKAPILLRYVTR